jgi:hypothetical protein
MDWKQKVPGCFGLTDVEFGLHPTDRVRAELAIKAAQGSGAGFDDFEKEVVWHCYKHFHDAGRHSDHTAKQVAAARQLWSQELRSTLTLRKLETLSQLGG